MPAEFWNTEGGWIQLRTNPVGHRSLLRVLNPISRELHAPTDSDRAEGRNFAPYLNPAGLRDFEERLRPLLAFANSGGDPQLRIFPTLDSFSRALDGVIRAAVRARGASADGAWQRRMSEPARLALNEVRARLDKSNRAFYATVTGKRAMFERQLLPAATTLVVVPEPLLEHWFEMFRRHVDLRCLQPRSDGGGGRSAVWIDGVGDMSTVAQFRLRPAPYALCGSSIRGSGAQLTPTHPDPSPYTGTTRRCPTSMISRRTPSWSPRLSDAPASTHAKRSTTTMAATRL